MTAKELKQILSNKGVDTSDCIEKEDLVRKYRATYHLSATGEPETKPSRSGSATKRIKKTRQTLGGLDCILVDTSETQPKLAVILSHWLNGSNEELEAIASASLSSMDLPEMLLVFPNGPLSMGGKSRAWWPVNFEHLLMQHLSGDHKSMFAQAPPGLPESRAKMISLVDEVKKKTGLPTSKIVLVGFSQGSMLSVDVAMHLNETVGGLGVFMGVLLCPTEWSKMASRHKGLRVIQTHGTQDPLLPYAFSLQLKQFFESNGMKLDFHSWNGGHTLSPKDVPRIAAFLKDLASTESG